MALHFPFLISLFRSKEHKMTLHTNDIRKRRHTRMSILEVTGLKKTYGTRLGGHKVEALKNVNFSVEQGEFVAIMGESGS